MATEINSNFSNVGLQFVKMYYHLMENDSFYTHSSSNCPFYTFHSKLLIYLKFLTTFSSVNNNMFYRQGLAQFYTNESMMTFENSSFKGQSQILEKLLSNPSSKYAILTCDFQPSPNNGVVAFIMGTLTTRNLYQNTNYFLHIFYLYTLVNYSQS
ncbi:nuclear transport factor 2, putative [Theileria annulata]|uniref:Nuclear transport factor 2, putative n=1 Tax=Theileria annulata TaxID=5874 RepID=Q4UDB7_THEAN|nr:nuclear transport factor 2, putative [Theileria annulata]CAI74922.1 nuclear transport factor 2, putative [Theileria annulata]|eukprot:XP_952654.1 nuclear transport factor 2, putative [Theileria annulata]